MSRTSKAESERVRLAILRATTDEIAEHGYQGLRVAAVAARIGKTQGAVYGRFANKEALALAAIRHLRDGILLPRIMVAVSGSGSALESVEQVSATIAKVAEEYPNGQLVIARLASELAGATGPMADEIRGLVQTFVRVLENLFETAKDNGELRTSIDTKRLAHAVVGLPFAFATVSRMYPDHAPYADLEATLSAILTRGVSKKTTPDD